MLNWLRMRLRNYEKTNLKMNGTQKVDNLTKNIVCGYIREQQKLLNSSNCAIFQTIPDGIILLCALYFAARDYFDITPDHVIISRTENGDSCITSKMHYIEGDGGTNFGAISIPSTNNTITSKWYVEIVAKPYSALLVGISSKPFDPKKDCHVKSGINIKRQKGAYNHHSYMFANHGGGRSYVENKWKWGGTNFKEGDIVTIELNLYKKKLKLFVNESESPLAYDVVCGDQIEYRLAVILFDKGNSVSIIRSTQMIVS